MLCQRVLALVPEQARRRPLRNPSWALLINEYSRAL